MMLVSATIAVTRESILLTTYTSQIEDTCVVYKRTDQTQMGNLIDLNWYVYRRAQSSDEWIGPPLYQWGDIQLDEALRRFKHEVYTFVLSRDMKYEDTKTIYLYQGHTRIAKAYLNPETKQVEIWSNSVREWLTCSEKVTQTKTPPYATTFFKQYIDKHTWINTQTIAFVHKE